MSRTVEPTKLSSRGQLVIPKKMREALRWNTGENVTVELKNDQLILRKLTLDDVLAEADQRVSHFSQIWPMLQVKEMVIMEAIRGVEAYQFSYWDGLIWATARLNQGGTILSEDFSHDSFIGGEETPPGVSQAFYRGSINLKCCIIWLEGVLSKR